MRPLDYDRLEEAADLMTHFRCYWDQCALVDEPEEARQQLMAKIIDRAFVYDNSVIAVALHPDIGVVLDVLDAAPDQILSALSEAQKKYNQLRGQLCPERGRRASKSHKTTILSIQPRWAFSSSIQ